MFLRNKNKNEERKYLPYSLDDKVDKFIEWCEEIEKANNRLSGCYDPTVVRNFIEKIAVWYELRYPDYEVNKIMSGSSTANKNISDIMFKDNLYLQGILEDDSLIKDLKWDEFYNTHAFISSLSGDERFLISRPSYPKIVYLNHKKRASGHFHLSKRGIIQETEYSPILGDNYYDGRHITEVVEELKINNLIDYDSEIYHAIDEYKIREYAKQQIFECAMYRIIERGGNRFGPRRGFLFAKEFNCDIDIPMQYGVDLSDPGRRLFINEYLKAGGRQDLTCYIGYHNRPSKYASVEVITVGEMLENYAKQPYCIYTSEEKNLHQRLVDILASQVDYDVVEEAQIKTLRLERKLNRNEN